jgi:hypothetical protein
MASAFYLQRNEQQFNEIIELLKQINEKLERNEKQ